MIPSEQCSHRALATALDFHFTPIGVALELPRSSRPKTGGGTKRVLHKLHVAHLTGLQLAQNGEWSRHRLAQFSRRVGKSSEDRNLVAFSENILGNKRFDVPEFRDIMECLADGFYPVTSTAPGHDFLQVRITVVEGNVGDIRRAQLLYDFWFADPL